MLWDDVLEHVELEITTTTEKKECMEDLKMMLNDLQDVQLWFEMEPDPRFTEAAETKLKDLRSKAAQMLKEVRAKLNEDIEAQMETPVQSKD